MQVLHFPNNAGETPLMIAAQGGHLEIVKLLPDENTRARHYTPPARTPLGAAAAAGHLEVVRYLLERGVNVDLPDARGRTPLHEALGSHKLHVVRLLLQRGADLNYRANNGHKPVTYTGPLLAGGNALLDLLLERYGNSLELTTEDLLALAQAYTSVTRVLTSDAEQDRWHMALLVAWQTFLHSHPTLKLVDLNVTERAKKAESLQEPFTQKIITELIRPLQVGANIRAQQLAAILEAVMLDFFRDPRGMGRGGSRR